MTLKALAHEVVWGDHKKERKEKETFTGELLLQLPFIIVVVVVINVGLCYT